MRSSCDTDDMNSSDNSNTPHYEQHGSTTGQEEGKSPRKILQVSRVSNHSKCQLPALGCHFTCCMVCMRCLARGCTLKLTEHPYTRTMGYADSGHLPPSLSLALHLYQVCRSNRQATSLAQSQWYAHCRQYNTGRRYT